MGRAGVSIDATPVPSARRVQRSVKSLKRVKPPTVVVDVEGLSEAQTAEIYRRVSALANVIVPSPSKDEVRVISSDPNAYLRTFRAVEVIIEDVT